MPVSAPCQDEGGTCCAGSSTVNVVVRIDSSFSSVKFVSVIKSDSEYDFPGNAAFDKDGNLVYISNFNRGVYVLQGLSGDTGFDSPFQDKIHDRRNTAPVLIVSPDHFYDPGDVVCVHLDLEGFGARNYAVSMQASGVVLLVRLGGFIYPSAYWFFSPVVVGSVFPLGGGYQAAWGFENRAFFASDEGHGVVEVLLSSLSPPNVAVTLAGKSSKVESKGDGLNCAYRSPFGLPLEITKFPTARVTEPPSFSVLPSYSNAAPTPRACTAAGKLCVFPFIYKGETVSACTVRDDTSYWCATSVDSANYMQDFEYCDSGCFASQEASVRPQLSTSVPTPVPTKFPSLPGFKKFSIPFVCTSNDTPCIFPFRYLGEFYSQCTSSSDRRPWCATAVDKKDHQILSWGYCDANCIRPTAFPTKKPTYVPTLRPTTQFPSQVPTSMPTQGLASSRPTPFPTSMPTSEPTQLSTCSTISGSRCSFPFRYNGQQIADGCTNLGANGYWCAVKTNDNLDVLEWDFCDPRCKKTTGALTLVGNDGKKVCSSNGTRCVFPFKFQDLTFNACTNFADSKFWCALAVDKTEQMLDWGYCDSPDCIHGPDEAEENPICSSGSQLCAFPFKYQGKTFNEGCARGKNGKSWCALTVDGDRELITWGACDQPYCKPFRPLVKSSQQMCTGNGKPCVFPFQDSGNLYHQCKSSGSSKPWCATIVDARLNVVGWEECDTNCLNPPSSLPTSAVPSKRPTGKPTQLHSGQFNSELNYYRPPTRKPTYPKLPVALSLQTKKPTRRVAPGSTSANVFDPFRQREKALTCSVLPRQRQDFRLRGEGSAASVSYFQNWWTKPRELPVLTGSADDQVTVSTRSLGELQAVQVSTDAKVEIQLGRTDLRRGDPFVGAATDQVSLQVSMTKVKMLYTLAFSSFVRAVGSVVQGEDTARPLSTLQFEVKFGQPVHSLKRTSLKLANCNLQQFVRLDASTFHVFCVAGRPNAYISLDVPAGSARSINGASANEPARSRLLYTFADLFVRLVASFSGLSISTSFSMEAVFGRPIQGLHSSHFVVVNGEIQNLRLKEGSQTSYSFDVVPINSGFVSVELPEASVTTVLNVHNQRSNKVTVRYVAPELRVFLEARIGNSTHLKTFPFRIRFSDAVTDGKASLVPKNFATFGGRVLDGVEVVSNFEFELMFEVAQSVILQPDSGPMRIAFQKSRVKTPEKLWNQPSKPLLINFDPCLGCASEAQPRCKLTRFGAAACSCPLGYTGMAFLRCLACPGGSDHPCSGHGRCLPVGVGDLENKCVCDPDWGGDSCSIFVGIPPLEMSTFFVDFDHVRISFVPMTGSVLQEISSYRIVVDCGGNKTKIDVPKETVQPGIRFVADFRPVKSENCTVTGFGVATDEFGNFLGGGAKVISTVVLRPVIESITILPGREGDVAVLKGSQFLGFSTNTLGSVDVYFGPLEDPEKYKCIVVLARVQEITCQLQPGVGANLRFKLVSNGYSSALSSFEYSFPAPTVSAQSLDIVATSRYFQTPGNITGFTDSGDVLILRGENFGFEPSDVVVQIGNLGNCDVLEMNSTFLKCRTKIECDSKFSNPVNVFVGGQRAAFTPNFFWCPGELEIRGVSGCLQHPTISSQTIKCPTRGGNRLTVYGQNFVSGDYSVALESILVLVDGQKCLDLTIVSREELSCTLPAGVGINVPVAVKSLSFYRQAKLLSYAPPNISSVSGCPPEGCSRTGLTRLTIIGTNFGSGRRGLAQVEVKNLGLCTNLRHGVVTPHEKLTCDLPRGGGLRDLMVTQFQGATATPVVGSVKYQQCPPGTEQAKSNSECVACPPGKFGDHSISFECITCSPGTFSSKPNQTSCTQCPPGKFQPSNGNTLCFDCDTGEVAVSSGATRCEKCWESKSYEFYNHSQCLPCQQNMFCHQPVPYARQNYFLLTSAVGVEVLPCAQDMCYKHSLKKALVILSDESYGCAPNSRGILCGECVEDTYPLGVKCAPCLFGWWWVLFLAVANYFIVYMIYRSNENVNNPKDSFVRTFLGFFQSITTMFVFDDIFFVSIFSFLAFNYGSENTEFCFQSDSKTMLQLTLFQPIMNYLQLLLQMIVHRGLHWHKTVAHFKISNRPFPRFDYRSYQRAVISLFFASFHSTAFSCLRLVVCVDVNGVEVVQAQPTVRCDQDWYIPIKYTANTIQILQLVAIVFMLFKVCRAVKVSEADDQKISYWLMVRTLLKSFTVKGQDNFESRESKDESESEVDEQLNQMMDVEYTGDTRKQHDLQVQEMKKRQRVSRARLLGWGPTAPPFAPPKVSKFLKLQRLYDGYGPFIIPYRQGYFLWEFEVMLFKYLTVYLVIFVHNFNDKCTYLGLASLCQIGIFLIVNPHRGREYLDVFNDIIHNHEEEEKDKSLKTRLDLFLGSMKMAENLEIYALVVKFLVIQMTNRLEDMPVLKDWRTFFILTVWANALIGYYFASHRHRVVTAKFTAALDVNPSQIQLLTLDALETQMGEIDYGLEAKIEAKFKLKQHKSALKSHRSQFWGQKKEGQEAPIDVLEDLRQFYNRCDGAFGSVDLKIALWNFSTQGTMLPKSQGLFSVVPATGKNMLKTSEADRMLSKIRFTKHSGKRNFHDFVSQSLKKMGYKHKNTNILVANNNDVACEEMLALVYHQVRKNQVHIKDSASLAALVDVFGISVKTSCIEAAVMANAQQDFLITFPEFKTKMISFDFSAEAMNEKVPEININPDNFRDVSGNVIVCHFCKGYGHTLHQCPTAFQNVCGSCGGHGHSSDVCKHHLPNHAKEESGHSSSTSDVDLKKLAHEADPTEPTDQSVLEALQLKQIF